jgi:hypothetical protein
MCRPVLAAGSTIEPGTGATVTAEGVAPAGDMKPPAFGPAAIGDIADPDELTVVDVVPEAAALLLLLDWTSDDSVPTGEAY